MTIRVRIGLFGPGSTAAIVGLQAAASMSDAEGPMHIAEIWRYPVKSMAGERLERAVVGPLGIEGDRVVHVRRSLGRIATARTFPRLLGHRATLGPDGTPLVDGRPWSDPSVLEDVRGIVGSAAELLRDDTARRFDKLPLLVATDGAIAAFGRDGRRLRPNIVVGGVEGLDEREWEGLAMRAGEVVIGFDALRARCVMTTYDPDTQLQDPDVLKDIVRRFDGTLALDSFVVRPGVLRVGDRVEVGVVGAGLQRER